ncbi:MAG: hypothetical protein ABII75_05315 [Candidatus Omnitrophota bacterium]
MVKELMDNVNNDPVKPKRRIRYKGNHPRHFEEKYKELNFERNNRVRVISLDASSVRITSYAETVSVATR